ncbi:MAG: patatin-like phospholipase family protein [Myxococcales bacterium]|nr:patatin-like phospholipase family protein [Myxococcales bacterium]
MFDRLEARVVQLYLARPDADVVPVYESLRYALSFARLTGVRTSDGDDIDVDGPLQLHAWTLRDLVEPLIKRADSLWEVARVMPEVVASTRRARASLLEHLPIPREDLEAEVTTRLLAVASGGGGGAGYVYPGCYEQLEHHGLAPSLMAGTSIGALMAMFRARRARYDMAPLIAGARALAWTRVFGAFHTKNRYGMPAALRLQLRHLLGSMFRTEDDSRPLWLSDMGIPLFIVATGITMDALKHDLDYYEHLLDDDLRSGMRAKLRSGFKTIGVIREFLARRDALEQVVLGRTPGTEDFDVLDAAGFSAAIPGVIHYDVLRDDPRMVRILDALYADHGITRLGEGGMVSNVPARICWETVVSGAYGRRNVFVLALDCFAPHARKLAWFPLMQAVRTANVEDDLQFADFYLDFDRTLSPMNLVPSVKDAMTAMRWGSRRMEPHMPFITEMMRPIPVLGD